MGFIDSASKTKTLSPEAAARIRQDLEQCQTARLRIGVVPGGDGVWFRVQKDSHAVLNSNQGWRYWNAGERAQFSLTEEVFRMDAKEFAVLARHILSQLEEES